MSGGKGKQDASGGMPPAIQKIITEGWEEQRELRGSLIDTFESILTGGQTATTVPMIGQAQEAQRRATSQAMAGTEQQLAQKGLAGTPFGEMITSQQRQQGAQAVAGVPTDITQWFMQMIPGYTQGAAQSIMGALPGTRETVSSGKSIQGAI